MTDGSATELELPSLDVTLAEMGRVYRVAVDDDGSAKVYAVWMVAERQWLGKGGDFGRETEPIRFIQSTTCPGAQLVVELRGRGNIRQNLGIVTSTSQFE